MRTSEFERERQLEMHRGFFPFLLKKEKISKREASKIDFFEKGLAKEIKKTDSINLAITKMVRMALACEFGPVFVRAKGIDQMVNTIVQGILQDPELRKQSLLIIDRYARED